MPRPPRWDQQVQHLAFPIEGAPERHRRASGIADSLVRVPCTGRLSTQPTQVTREHRPEPQNPASNRPVGDLVRELGQALFSIMGAVGDAEVEPIGMPDDPSWKPVTSIADRLHPCLLLSRPARMQQSRHSRGKALLDLSLFCRQAPATRSPLPHLLAWPAVQTWPEHHACNGVKADATRPGDGQVPRHQHRVAAAACGHRW